MLTDQRGIVRAKVGATHLKIYHEHGKEFAVEVYKGTADASLLNIAAHIGLDAVRAYVCQVFDALKPERTKLTLVK